MFTNAELERLSQDFLNDIYRIPGGEKIKQCIQCGTCSASCPTSEAMDHTPREIIACFRAGMLDKENGAAPFGCASGRPVARVGERRCLH